jgi:hypothetical protein
MSEQYIIKGYRLPLYPYCLNTKVASASYISFKEHPDAECKLGISLTCRRYAEELPFERALVIVRNARRLFPNYVFDLEPLEEEISDESQRISS